MKITYCHISNASYLYIKEPGWTADKTKEIGPNVYVDYDKDGNVLGIELLGVDRPEIELLETKLPKIDLEEFEKNIDKAAKEEKK